MKKLLALIALVAMVAVSSVAYAVAPGDVTVTGTLGEILDITGCTGASNPMTLTFDTDKTNVCTNHYASNDADGYKLSFAATTASMKGTGTAAGETLSAINGTTCEADKVTLECFSYTFTVNDPEAGTGTYGTGKNGTVDTNEDDVPTAAFAAFTSAAADEGDNNYTFTFHAVAQQASAAGGYQLDGGTITIAGL